MSTSLFRRKKKCRFPAVCRGNLCLSFCPEGLPVCRGGCLGQMLRVTAAAVTAWGKRPAGVRPAPVWGQPRCRPPGAAQGPGPGPPYPGRALASHLRGAEGRRGSRVLLAAELRACARADPGSTPRGDLLDPGVSGGSCDRPLHHAGEGCGHDPGIMPPRSRGGPGADRGIAPRGLGLTPWSCQ